MDLRPVIVLASLALLVPTSAAAAVPNLEYYGGPVLSNVQVIQVSWTSSVDGTLQSTLPGFYKSIVSSGYIDWLGEYDTVGLNGKDSQPGSNQRVRRGSFGGAFTITPSNAAKALTFADVATELAVQIAAKNLPGPQLDAAGNVLSSYAIDFPNGYTLTDSIGRQSCAQFCAENAFLTVGGNVVPISILPFIGTGSPCAGGCGTEADVDNETFWHSFALLDAITNPDFDINTVARPYGWYDSTKGGAGMACFGVNKTVSLDSTRLGGFLVAKGWSNKLAACVVTDPSLPLCNSTTHPCRPCAPADCLGTSPACEDSPGHPKQSLCVQCTSDTDCKVPTPQCDRTTDTCVAGTSADAGAGDSGAPPDAGADAGAAGAAPDGSGGCSCTATGSSPGLGWILAVAVAVGGRVFRRRRR